MLPPPSSLSLCTCTLALRRLCGWRRAIGFGERGCSADLQAHTRSPDATRRAVPTRAPSRPRLWLPVQQGTLTLPDGSQAAVRRVWRRRQQQLQQQQVSAPDFILSPPLLASLLGQFFAADGLPLPLAAAAAPGVPGPWKEVTGFALASCLQGNARRKREGGRREGAGTLESQSFPPLKREAEEEEAKCVGEQGKGLQKKDGSFRLLVFAGGDSPEES